jgi:hypothetical protein
MSKRILKGLAILISAAWTGCELDAPPPPPAGNGVITVSVGGGGGVTPA